MRPTPTQILQQIEETTEVSIEHILSESRMQDFAHPRFFGYYLFIFYGYTPAETAMHFKRDRGSIYHGLRQAQFFVEMEPKFKKWFEKIKGNIEKDEIRVQREEYEHLCKIRDKAIEFKQAIETNKNAMIKKYELIKEL